MIKSLAVAAALATLGFASQASAVEANPTGGYIVLENASMVQTYTANVGTSAGTAVNAYSNGVTFSYQNSTSAGVTSGAVYTLYGFCIDVAHHMSLGNLNYIYSDTYGANYPVSGDPVPNSFLLGSTTWTSAAPNSNTTGSALNKLIDTGWLLHESQTGQSAAYIANTNLQLAAIQAAIWKTEGAYVSVNNGTATAGANVGGTIAGSATYTYSDYFNYYSNLNFTPLSDSNDKFYTILDTATNPAHQGFAVGWPVPNVPEPTTWALMIVGFFGAGAAVRRRRSLATAAI
jgi:hypothetical protein